MPQAQGTAHFWPTSQFRLWPEAFPAARASGPRGLLLFLFWLLLDGLIFLVHLVGLLLGLVWGLLLVTFAARRGARHLFPKPCHRKPASSFLNDRYTSTQIHKDYFKKVVVERYELEKYS